MFNTYLNLMEEYEQLDEMVSRNEQDEARIDARKKIVRAAIKSIARRMRVVQTQTN